MESEGGLYSWRSGDHVLCSLERERASSFSCPGNSPKVTKRKERKEGSKTLYGSGISTARPPRVSKRSVDRQYAPCGSQARHHAPQSITVSYTVQGNNELNLGSHRPVSPLPPNQNLVQRVQRQITTTDPDPSPARQPVINTSLHLFLQRTTAPLAARQVSLHITCAPATGRLQKEP